MKKLIFGGTAAIIIALTSFTSCKKDYTCVCTTTYDVGQSTQYTKTETVGTYKATHKSAEKSCQDNNTEHRTCDLQ